MFEVIDNNTRLVLGKSGGEDGILNMGWDIVEEIYNTQTGDFVGWLVDTGEES